MDYSQYHPDWKDVIRPAILQRDNYVCQHCRIKHKSRVYVNTLNNYVICDSFMELWAKNEGKKVFTLFLQVAHLDHDKDNNEPENLRTLCPKCHANFDKEHKKLMRISYIAKASKPVKFSDQDILNDRQAVLKAIRVTVKEVTNVSIHDHEANHILTTIFNSISDVTNK